MVDHLIKIVTAQNRGNLRALFNNEYLWCTGGSGTSYGRSAAVADQQDARRTWMQMIPAIGKQVGCEINRIIFTLKVIEYILVVGVSEGSKLGGQFIRIFEAQAGCKADVRRRNPVNPAADTGGRRNYFRVGELENLRKGLVRGRFDLN